MFIIPGFVQETEENGSLFVKSYLYDNEIKLSDPNLINEYKQLKIQGCSNASTELEQFLQEQSMLFPPKELNELLAPLNNSQADHLTLTIMPTERCNFRCPYCYEDHRAADMEQFHIDAIKTYIAQKAPHIKGLNVSWFGGEPTLFPQYIEEVNTFAQAQAEKNNIPFFSNITTNGYLLNKELFTRLLHWGVTEYQITLDGWNHDKTRYLASGKPTLQTILANLKEISSLPAEDNFKIMVRHNVLAGDLDFTWYDFLKQKFGGDPRFTMLIRLVGNMGGESVKEMNLATGSSGKALEQQHIDYVKKIGFTCENDAVDYSYTYRSSFCYASRPNTFIFRPDGRISKCSVILEDPRNCVGKIDPMQGVVIDEEKNKLWHQNTIPEKCISCKELLSCMNKKCPRNRILADSDCCCPTK